MLHQVIACLLLFAATSQGLTPTEEYTHSATLRSGNIKLYWKFTDDDITFEVHGQTTGWIGIGYSPNGAMTGADIIVGWVKNGVVKVTDRHGVGNVFPPKDPEQNIDVITGAECDGWTMFKFSRQLAACEKEYDREITSSTLRLIWAYGDEDPLAEDIQPSDYHGTKRGGESMYFLEWADQPTDLPAGPTYKTFDILVDEFNIPAEDTYYNCKLYKLPKMEGKHHIVKLEAIIQPGNELNVHHMVIYECGDVLKNPGELGVEERCYTPNMQHFSTCRQSIAVWAVGGGVQYYPDDAGYSLGAPGDPIYIQLEIHYDNPMMRSDIVDSSGMRITYTDTLRKHDVGVISMGNAVFGLTHFVPPRAESFLSVGVCSPQCLGKRMEVSQITGVTVFGVTLHAHLAGRSLKLRHFRNGTELPYMAIDETYDFNYQESRFLHPTVELKNTDTLRMECVYNTEGRSKVTEGGLGTPQEMCFAFVYYYPKIDLSGCFSTASLTELWPYFGISMRDFVYKQAIEPSLSDYNVTVNGSSEVKTAFEVISEYHWTEETVDKFAKDYTEMTQTFMCVPGNASQTTIDYQPMPAIESEYVPPTKNCSAPMKRLHEMQTARQCLSSGIEGVTSTPPMTTTSSSSITIPESHFISVLFLGVLCILTML